MRRLPLAILFCACFGLLCFAGYLVKITSGASVTSLLNAGNTAPTVSSISINNNQATITLTPNTTTNVNVTASVSDNDGCADVTNATATILLYRSGIGSSTCLSLGSTNSLNCYVATTFTASSTCSGTSANTTTTFAVQYYAQATDASSSFQGQNWMATLIFTDPSSTTASIDSTSVSSTNDMATLLAINLPTSTIDYGLLSASSTTSSTNQLLNIENAGNATHTVAVSGNAFTSGANSIATSSQHYATSSFTYGGGEAALSSAATTITGITTAPVINFPIGGAGWQNTSALRDAMYGQSLVAYNGYVYNIGGFTGFTTTSTVSFAPINASGSIGAWSSAQALPYAVDTQGSVVYNGYLYSIGGCLNLFCSSVTSTVLFAHINATGSIGAWSVTQPLPDAIRSAGSGIYNGYIYMTGGVNPTGETSTVLFAHINATGSIGAWSVTQPLPYADYLHTSIAYNGYLYTIGGAASTSLAVADTSTVLFAPINATGSIGAWSVTQPLPYILEQHNSVAYDGYLYTIGGGAIGGPTSTVIIAPFNATGSIGNWVSTQPLPYSDSAPGAVVYNGYLYLTGGNSGGSITSTAIFTPLNARSTYWGMSVPGNAVAGSYTDSITLTASYSP